MTAVRIGTCSRCRKNQPIKDKKTCQRCRDQVSKWFRDHPELVKKHNQKYRTEYKEACAARSAKYRKANAAELAAKKSAYYNNIKIDVMSAYGGVVCECGEKRLGALTIDHINGNGKKHRKSIGKDGKHFYLWLRKNNYPPGYRVLCSNCNIIAWIESDRKLATNRQAVATRKYCVRVKAKFFNALGNSCVCCSKSDIRILTVHHINNDGANHRRQISNGFGGIKFYNAILASNDFTGLECRCFSCNDNGE